MMEKMLIKLLLIIGMLWCNIALAALPIERNISVAVMDFGTRPGATTAAIDITNAQYTSSEYIVNSLAKDARYIVMDKDLVANKLKQENLKTVGLIDPDTAKRLGQILHVNYLIYGNVTNVSFSGTGVEALGLTAGGGVNVNTVRADIVARMMDVNTGNIVTAAKGMGKSKSSYVKVRTAPVCTVTIGTARVTQDSVHNAIQKAAGDVVNTLTGQLYGSKTKNNKKS